MNKLLAAIAVVSTTALVIVCSSTAKGSVGINRKTSEVWFEVNPIFGRRSYFKLNDLTSAMSQHLQGV